MLSVLLCAAQVYWLLLPLLAASLTMHSSGAVQIRACARRLRTYSRSEKCNMSTDSNSREHLHLEGAPGC
ncbi:hypothetical protein [Paenibacillus sp. SN-8-1]|uniref:hypothetical protein n=1 Tax=Paenibacillus sp. SN-8-1 TaxID=3435409 RepID=UPI003D9A3EFE